MDLYINGKAVKPGQQIKDFRGKNWTFETVSRNPEPGKSGKVLVHPRGRGCIEFYPSVFGGEIK
jgi:hypothetical protein